MSLNVSPNSVTKLFTKTLRKEQVIQKEKLNADKTKMESTQECKRKRKKEKKIREKERKSLGYLNDNRDKQNRNKTDRKKDRKKEKKKGILKKNMERSKERRKGRKIQTNKQIKKESVASINIRSFVRFDTLQQ